MKSACAGLLGIGLGASAEAFEVNETTSPLVTAIDFNDDFPGEALPQGVTSIVGSVGLLSAIPEIYDNFDHFQLTGLAPGTQLGVLADFERPISFNLTDSQGSSITTFGAEGEFTAQVPGDGIVVGIAQPGEGGISGAYTLAINATYVPEPGTGALAALGAAALLGLSQRKRD
jgi:hypothetical protein